MKALNSSKYSRPSGVDDSSTYFLLRCRFVANFGRCLFGRRHRLHQLPVGGPQVLHRTRVTSNNNQVHNHPRRRRRRRRVIMQSEWHSTEKRDWEGERETQESWVSIRIVSPLLVLPFQPTTLSKLRLTLFFCFCSST